MSKDKSLDAWQMQAVTVASAFKAAAQHAPDAMYCKSAAGALNYGQAAGAIQTLADELREDVQGRAVALILPNSPAFLIAYFAILFAGGKPALINHGHPDSTIAKLLGDLDAAVILSDRVHPGAKTRILTEGALNDLFAPVGIAPVDMARLIDPTEPDDIAAILYSGGTTGLPKQVPHSNAAIVATMERGDWGWRTGADEIWLPVAPFTHIYGFLMGLTNPIIRAGGVVIPDRFQPDLIVDMLVNEGVTIFGGGPPAIYQGVMSSAKFADATFPKLRICPGGGAPFPLDVHRRWEAATDLKIYEGYGMTEIAPISINTEAHGILRGSAGKAVPDTVIEIVDLETGDTVLEVGEAGEIRVKGPHMMTGYTGDMDETAIALRHGFVYTGDIGTLDADGFLTITDRKKNVIFVSGFNVFPREVEELLLTHPAVSGACVVARAHPRSGEVPVAFITLRSHVSADDVASFCRDNLIAYKQPAEVVILPEMPLTPAGKVDRSALQSGLKAT
ncbi:Long-chain-fatty-acid--CoA ligase [Ascidiaceihabitans donghaensis]|uniref:Long-chain-fatty-acid--CoA ligase n=1 Tax=Ascidiaceihabitans donghaensis TaxID=1510460 RepID=A0A2R8BPR3_9RHOB|nr:AMP-binding protein [Ascidiaceihabitans donghaensis]SPH27587.1 Long-chain-fatty-acid--CoA ligase [Ascidiaceihabitans donghaensis]